MINQIDLSFVVNDIKIVVYIEIYMKNWFFFSFI